MERKCILGTMFTSRATILPLAKLSDITRYKEQLLQCLLVQVNKKKKTLYLPDSPVEKERDDLFSFLPFLLLTIYF